MSDLETVSALPLVGVRELSKAYGSVQALKGVSLSIARGQIFGLLGPNGSGKTTLIRTLMGFLRPTGGAATIGGLDCYHDSVAVHRLVSYLPGDVRLLRATRARDVLQFFAQVRGQQDVTESLRIAERLGLDLARRVGQMSTGMRQKLALAAVLAVDAPLLILDEPTSNLDPTIRSTVVGLIREARDAGRTVIFSSHVLSEIEQTCDRVVILRSGELVHDQRMADVRRGHRIRVSLTEALPPIPPALAAQLAVVDHTAGQATIDALGELAPLMAWLAALPAGHLQIDPIGLDAVYQQYHSSDAAANEVAA